MPSKCTYDETGAIAVCDGLGSIVENDSSRARGLTRVTAMRGDAKVNDPNATYTYAIFLRKKKNWAARLNFCPVCGGALHEAAT